MYDIYTYTVQINKYRLYYYYIQYICVNWFTWWSLFWQNKMPLDMEQSKQIAVKTDFVAEHCRSDVPWSTLEKCCRGWRDDCTPLEGMLHNKNNPVFRWTLHDCVSMQVLLGAWVKEIGTKIITRLGITLLVDHCHAWIQGIAKGLYLSQCQEMLHIHNRGSPPTFLGLTFSFWHFDPRLKQKQFQYSIFVGCESCIQTAYSCAALLAASYSCPAAKGEKSSVGIS